MNIILFGKRGSGKDTTLEIIKDLVPNTVQIRLASYVVRACNALGIENPTRDDLAYVGHDIGRMLFGMDVWLKQAIKDANGMIGYHNMVVSDARYQNEYDAFVDIGFIPVLIETDLDKCIERVIKRDGYINMEQLNHESENNYKKFKPRYVLDNNGTIEELEAQVEAMLREIIFGE